MESVGNNKGDIWAARPKFRLKTVSGRILETAAVPLIMGVLNVTPDSFSDGGEFFRTDLAVAHARDMVLQGADIIDVGGESTRPGSIPVDEEQELDRVVPVIDELSAECDVPISIDTRKSAVAAAAIAAGAEIVNDVSGLRHDPGMVEVAVSSGALVCIMHMQGEPGTMQDAPRYTDVVADVRKWLESRAEVLVSAGINRSRVIIDPGFGFGKRAEHNLEILRRLEEFHQAGFPLLIGTSRKSTIGEVLGRPAEERLYGTLATVTAAVLSGAHILRVHDVGATKDAAVVAEAILRGRGWRK